ncbi:hypothetical protein [Jannaschia sp. LMIT008]|uniref:hypothetical protein n=1 Tax=Jannaschia maritima TaxID=3032585 RepID=UPI0028117DB1|nr:hypothetical protein [Jannaschia sp. LMIT008]
MTIRTIATAAVLAAIALPAAAQSQDRRAQVFDRVVERWEARGFSDIARETGGTRDYLTANGPDGAIRVPLPTEAERAERRARVKERRAERGRPTR